MTGCVKSSCNRGNVDVCCGTCADYSPTEAPPYTLPPGGCTDTRGIMISGRSCSAHVAVKGRGTCYQNVMQTHCCETCLKYIDKRAISCEFGDDTSVVWSGGQSCSQLVSQKPKSCDQDSVRKSCCASCRALESVSGSVVSKPWQPVTKSPLKNECEDRQNVKINGKSCLELIRDQPANCYSQQTLTYCCASCRKTKQNVAGCEYGDKLVKFSGKYICAQLLRSKPNACQQASVHENCCQSCRNWKEKKPAASSCTDQSGVRINGKTCRELISTDGPGQCYSEKVQKWCCETCDKVKTSDGDCIWGDKRTIFNGVYTCDNILDWSARACSMSNVKESCCKTCK